MANSIMYKHFFSLSAFTALNHFSRIILTLFLARLISPEQFGTFAALLALCEILLLPASMGFSSSLMRLSHPLFKNQQHDLLQGLKHTYLAASCLFGVLFVACVVTIFTHISPHQSAKEHVFYLLLIVPIGAVMQSQAAFLIALNKTKLGLLTQQCLFELLTTAFCLLVVLFFNELSLEVICQLLFAALLCVVVYQYWLIKPLLVTTPASYKTKSWCKYSLIMLASGAGTVIVAKLDVLLVHHWFGATGVSVFFPAIVIVGLLTILANAASQYLKPILLSEQANGQQIVELMRLLWRVNTIAIIFLSLLAHPLLYLYGEKQLEEGHHLLIILLIGQLLLPARVLASNIIKLRGNPLHNLYILLAATSITLLLASWLKNDYGITGVAVAFSIGFALGALSRISLVLFKMNTPVALLLGNNIQSDK